MYKSILITEKESILLEQILTNYLKTQPIESINVHILIKHINGVISKSDSEFIEMKH